MNIATPETVTDAFKLYHCISLNTTQLRFIDVVRQQNSRSRIENYERRYCRF